MLGFGGGGELVEEGLVEALEGGWRFIGEDDGGGGESVGGGIAGGLGGARGGNGAAGAGAVAAGGLDLTDGSHGGVSCR